MEEKIIATAENWRITSDGVQWILQRKRKNGWRPISFIRSERNILLRCLHEAGADEQEAAFLLSALPDTFDAWKAALSTSQAQETP